MKKPRGEQGLKKMARDFNVPTKPYEMGPNMRDADLTRGPLKHVPKESVSRVMDFGAPTEGPRDFRSTGSPASGTFAIGRVTTNAREKETRDLPAHQITGSFKITP